MSGALVSACRAKLLAAATLAIVAMLALGASGASAELQFAPGPHVDPLDVLGGPLDLTSVTFGQQATNLVLELHANTPWASSQLSSADGRTLCLVIDFHDTSIPATQICVTDDGAGHPLLTSAHVGPDGAPGPSRVIAALIGRPDPETLSAQFTPLAAGLPFGPIAWHVESRWTDDASCAVPSPCIDYVPDLDPVLATVSLLNEPRCFGAASRDPQHPCHNAALTHAVVPTPSDALITPNAYCSIIQRVDLVSVCAFGAAPQDSSSTIALIGDSHAEHWRGALEVVAQGRHWRGLSISRSGCPYTTTRVIVNSQDRSDQCATWNAEVRQWLTRHPEISTVFVSVHAAAHFAGNAQNGFRAAWARLPKTVTHLIVLRDSPQTEQGQMTCVDRAIARHELAGVTCAGLRRDDVKPDPEAQAANSENSPRFSVVDLNDFMCTATRCPAVVGGALVRKDNTHMTSIFNTTLGPYLLQAVNKIIPPS